MVEFTCDEHGNVVCRIEYAGQSFDFRYNGLIFGVNDPLMAEAAATELTRTMAFRLGMIRGACYNQGWADRGSKKRKQRFHEYGWMRDCR